MGTATGPKIGYAAHVGDTDQRASISLRPSVQRWMGVLAVILLAVVMGLEFGLGNALLVLAGGTLLGGILLFWISLQGLAGQGDLTLDEAMSLAAPSAEEEQKQAVLRALKDLEFERSVGKITDDDYRELSERYRSEAKALLLLVDRGMAPAMKQAESLLAERLKGKAGKARKKHKESPGASTPDAGQSSTSGAETETDSVHGAPALACANCQAENDADARFCKSCGHSLGDASSEEPA